VIEEPHLAPGKAATALARCAARCCSLLARRRVHQRPDLVGRRLRFADGTSSAVYRETVVDRHPAADPAVLVVCFRLRGIHRAWAHTLFRVESELNTVLFAGFPGFVSKLWCRDDENGLYRGVYEWDDPDLAHHYVGALWWVLALVSVRGSIHYAVLPGLRRDEVLENPLVAYEVVPNDAAAWWRILRDAAVA
jgi:hypothetical protein